MTSADITGGREPRGVALRCSGCGVSMEPLELEDARAEVDVCPACGGLWIDWMDGEVRAVASETLRVSSPDLNADAETRSNEPVAIGACPRCSKHLVAERYVMTADVVRDSIPGASSPPISLVGKETGAELLRCEDCMGAFVSRASADVLAWLDTADAPPPSVGPASLRPVPWERFVKVLKGFLGLAKRQ